MKVKSDFQICYFDPVSASSEEKDWYRKNVHPHCLVPALVTSTGFVMTESAAICLYLAKLYGQCMPHPEHTPAYFK